MRMIADIKKKVKMLMEQDEPNLPVPAEPVEDEQPPAPPPENAPPDLEEFEQDPGHPSHEPIENMVPVKARVGMRVIRASGEVEDLGVIHEEKTFVPREMLDDWKE